MQRDESVRDHNSVRDDVISPPRVLQTGGEQRFVILIANAKGGCGKTTLATNLASHLAAQGKAVTLLDLDPLQSATSWLHQREKSGRRDIHGLSLKLDAHTTYGRLTETITHAREYLVIDSPAGLDGPVLDHVMRLTQVVIVPVLPSPIDIRAATRFLQAVMLTPSYRRRPRRLAVIANRTRARTRMYSQLRQFLSSLKIPYLVTLRDTQFYVQAAGEGIGVSDLDDPRAGADLIHWKRIIEWLEIQRHLIKAMPGFR